MIGFVRSADPQYSSAVINTNVIVSHTGEVVWLSHGIFRSSCDIDVEFFPFDEQRCVLKWASWTYDGYQVRSIFRGEISLPFYSLRNLPLPICLRNDRNLKAKDGEGMFVESCRKFREQNWAMRISRSRNSADRMQFSTQLTRTITKC